MRVLYFTRGYTPHDQRFLTALASTGHEIHYLRLETDQPAPSLPEGVCPVDWRGLPGEATLEAGLLVTPELRELAQSLKPDVIHAGPVQRVARLVTRAGLKPLVCMSWGSDLLLEAGQSQPWERATREALAGSAALVCDCQAVRQKAIDFGFPSERIVVFPWGVDLGYFYPSPAQELRRRLGWEDQLVLLSLRSWEPLYGVDVIAKAFVLAARQRAELRLVLMGSGSQEVVLRHILTEGGVRERVYIAGQAPEDRLPEWMRAADVYVSASRSDGSSVSLMQALACGLPALVSDIPGNREWVSSEEQGWLFPVGKAEALAELMVQTVDRRADLAKMGQRARQTAEQRADWSRNFPRLLEAYRMALEA